MQMHKSPLLCLPLQDPVEHAHHSLFLHAYVDQVEISNGGRLVAIYAHCYEREQDILNPIHYLPLLRERPGALDHAKPLKTWSPSHHLGPVPGRTTSTTPPSGGHAGVR